ncbi:MAG: polysaccharide deacetylase family protein [Armatimonadetes bacterium]|nr:polysaccharide deacetylase family protein [Armatimonadota bacterium]
MNGPVLVADSQETQPLAGRGSAPARVAAWVLVIAACSVLALYLQPGTASVNGLRVPVGRDWTAADCARFANLRTDCGALLDVTGRLISPEGGYRIRVWRGDREIALTSHIRPGEKLRIEPARDLVEPVADRIEYIPATCILADGSTVDGSVAASPVSAIRRERRGALSGKLVSREQAAKWAVMEIGSRRPPHRTLALTFDDGPDDAWTLKIMDALEERGARGTFFCMGHAVKVYPEVHRQTVARGHETGTHSWLHADYNKLSDAAIRADIRKCLETMKAAGAKSVRWCRPPYGNHSPRVDKVIAEFGLRIAMWDVDTNDWQLPGADKIVSRILRGAKDGGIILMHDGPRNREQTLAAVKRVVPLLQAQGYRLVTLSEAKGLVPVFTGEVRMRIGDREFVLKPLPADTILEVGAERLSLACVPLRVGDDYLVPAREVGTALGAQVAYDKKSETVTLQVFGRSGEFRLDSLHAEIDGAPIELDVPAVLYEGRAMVPVGVLKRFIPIGCKYDESRHVLSIAILQSAANELIQAVAAPVVAG